MESFANRLKELREEKGITQQELGLLVNMTKMAVSHWEKGHSEPSIAQLIFLSNYKSMKVKSL